MPRPHKTHAPAAASPTHVMCLVGSRGNLVVYLRSNWNTHRQPFTCKVTEAWSCVNGAGEDRLRHALSDLAQQSAGMGRFELRKTGSCPREIRLG